MRKIDILRVAQSCIGVSPASRTDDLELITEGRWREKVNGVRYSWCGDFATYCLMMAGCIDGSALNRVALNGVWKPGENISMLYRWAKDHDQLISADDVETGDIAVYVRPAGDHICIVSSALTSDRALNSIDGNSTNGAVCERQRYIDQDKLRWCMSTSLLMEQSAPASDPEYRPFPIPDMTGIEFPPILPFPAGWFFRVGPQGGVNWTNSPSYTSTRAGMAMIEDGVFTRDVFRPLSKGIQPFELDWAYFVSAVAHAFAGSSALRSLPRDKVDALSKVLQGQSIGLNGLMDLASLLTNRPFGV